MQTTPPVADITATLDPAGPAPELLIYDGGMNNFVTYSLDLYAPPDFHRIAALADHVDSRVGPNNHTVSGPGVPPPNKLPGTKLLYSAVLTSPVAGTWSTQVDVKQSGNLLGTARLTATVPAVPDWATGVIRIIFQ